MPLPSSYSREGATPLAGAAIGLLAGFVAGLLGVGGGLVIVPLVTLFLRVPIKIAVGTSLVSVVASSLIAVVTESWVAPDNLHLRIGLVLALGALLGARLGARMMARTSPGSLAIWFAVLLWIAALRIAMASPHAGGAVAVDGPIGVLLHIAAGVSAGFMSALFGVGGGIVAVPALVLLHPEWSFQAARATSLLMIVPTSTFGVMLHRRLGHIDRQLASVLVPFGLIGAILGVLVANRVPTRPLELSFAVLLIAAGARLAWTRHREPK